MDLPMLDFLKEKNTHTGSEGNFRYKLKPDGEEIKVWAYQTYCLEYCQEHGLMLGEETFPLDARGLEAAAAWLAEQQKKLWKKAPSALADGALFDAGAAARPVEADPDLWYNKHISRRAFPPAGAACGGAGSGFPGNGEMET